MLWGSWGLFTPAIRHPRNTSPSFPSQAQVAVSHTALPVRGSEAFAAEIAESGIPVVLTSGHPEGMARGRATGYAFLQKPFTVKELRRLTLDIVGAGDAGP